MPAIGFGARVTGGDQPNPRIIEVTTPGTGAGSLTEAVNVIDAPFESDQPTLPIPMPPTLIRIAAGLKIAANRQPIVIQGRNVTIEGGAGSEIHANQLFFDCATADNIIVRNLKFTGTPDDPTPPRDTIFIDGTNGRQPTGLWIDHCEFQAYFDLNITLKASDIGGAPPLLLTISNCLFHNDNPGGRHRDNNGGIAIAGFEDDSGNELSNRNINAYATVTGNLFRTVRRRSPRSSGLSVAHAFNNVLIEWGAGTSTTNQANGMESGHDGLLVAQANFFRAGNLKPTIGIATYDRKLKKNGGQLIIDDGDATLKNKYANEALATAPTGSPFSITRAYETFGITPPTVVPMDPTLRARIEAAAGVPGGSGN